MGRRYKIPELGFEEALVPRLIEEGCKWDWAASVAFLPNSQQKMKGHVRDAEVKASSGGHISLRAQLHSELCWLNKLPTLAET